MEIFRFFENSSFASPVRTVPARQRGSPEPPGRANGRVLTVRAELIRRCTVTTSVKMCSPFMAVAAVSKCPARSGACPHAAQPERAMLLANRIRLDPDDLHAATLCAGPTRRAFPITGPGQEAAPARSVQGGSVAAKTGRAEPLDAVKQGKVSTPDVQMIVNFRFERRTSGPSLLSQQRSKMSATYCRNAARLLILADQRAGTGRTRVLRR